MDKLTGQIYRRIIALFLSLMLVVSIGLPFFSGIEISAAGNPLSESHIWSFSTETASGRIWHVDDNLRDCPTADFKTIHDAVDECNSGDNATVYPSTYSENLDMNKDHLTIQSKNGDDSTIVQAANLDFAPTHETGNPLAEPYIWNLTTQRDVISGTEEEPYQIMNVNQLQEIKNDLSSSYILINDIDASDTKNWNGGVGFEPIGNEISPFTGTFNGNGHVIKSLCINITSPYTDGGLFRCTGPSAVIKSLGLQNENIATSRLVGGLIGENRGGSVSNCYSSGVVTGGSMGAGGLVGWNKGSINNSCSTSNVTGSKYGVGGLIGRNSGGCNVTNCYATGSVIGLSEVGGLVGYNYGSTNTGNASVVNSYSTGSVIGSDKFVGGLVGYTSNVIKNCYSTGSVTGSANAVGGLVGRNGGANVNNCYSTAENVTGNSSVGGFVGYNNGGFYMNDYWDSEISNQNEDFGNSGDFATVYGKTTSEMMTESTFDGLDFVSVWAIDEGESYPYLRNNEQIPHPGVSLDTTPPMVISVTPQSDASGVSLDILITATFSEPMDESTINEDSFIVEGSYVTGTVTHDPSGLIATFSPDVDLEYDHLYTATLTTEITDAAGNPLSESNVWSFTTTNSYTLESLDYFNTTEGHGIKYQVTDDYGSLDCDVWAVSQYSESNKPDEIDFVFTLVKEGEEGVYFAPSSLAGEDSCSYGSNNLTYFRYGYPVCNQGAFYRNFSLPRYFSSGDAWTKRDTEYTVLDIGAQTINSTLFDDCILITIDDSLNDSSYCRGSGYFILARDVGIVELVFDRTDGSTVFYEYLNDEQLTRHTISGNIYYNFSGLPVEGIIVQLSNGNWGTSSVTDAIGAFSVDAYGPDVLLRIGYDDDNNDVFEFDDPTYPIEYCVNDVTSDVTGLDIYIPAPDITVTPTSFEKTLAPDTIQNYILTIGNEGDADLIYNIADEDTTEPGAPGGCTNRPLLPTGKAIENPAQNYCADYEDSYEKEAIAKDEADDRQEGVISGPVSFELDIPIEKGSVVEPEGTFSAGGWQNIMTDDFEGDFPGTNWIAFAADGYADAYWGKDDSQYQSPSHSVYCAKEGSAGADPPEAYPDDMNTWMTYGPFSLENALDAELNFNCWFDIDDDYDKVICAASISGSHFYGRYRTGESEDWLAESFDLTDVGTLGNLCGQPEVWITFGFQSNNSIGDYGAFIDDVVLQKQDCSWISENPSSGTVPDGSPPDSISVTFDTTGLTEGDYSADIIINSNDPDEDPFIIPVTLHVEEDTVFDIGDTAKVKVIDTGDSWLNVRDEPAGSINTTVPDGWVLKIVDGPEYAVLEEKNYKWWEVCFDKYETSYVHGWVAEDFLELAPEDLVPSEPHSYFTVAQDKLEQAIAWAESKEGSNNWTGYCLRFVSQAFGQGENVNQQTTEWNSPEEGKTNLGEEFYSTNKCSNPPRGALIFFSASGIYCDADYDCINLADYGHIGVYMGNGEVVHAFGKVDTDLIVDIEALKGKDCQEHDFEIGSYIGWAYPPEDWLCPIYISSPLEITPGEAGYKVGDTLTATFNITNEGGKPVTLDELVVGGRHGSEVVDFSKAGDISLGGGESYHYEGSLTLPDKLGLHHFFCAYHTQQHMVGEDENNWNTSIDVKIDGEFVVNVTEAKRYRERDTIVYEETYISPAPPPILWEEIDGPWQAEQADLSQIAIPPSNPETIYAVVTYSDPYWGYGSQGDELYKSLNGGGNWILADEGLPSQRLSEHCQPIGAVAIAPSDPNVLYVGTSCLSPYSGGSGKGVYKSTNGGLTWATVGGPLYGLWPFEGHYPISSIAIDPTNPDKVYVGTLGGGIWRTTSGGEPWEKVWDQPIHKETVLDINALEVSTTDPNIVYGAAYNFKPGEAMGWSALLIANRLVRSKHGGDPASWEKLWGWSKYPPKIDDIAIDTNDTDIVYVISDTYKAYGTPDAGDNWHELSGYHKAALPYQPQFGHFNFFGKTGSICIHPKFPNVIFAAGQWGLGSTYYSPDSGEHWFPAGPMGSQGNIQQAYHVFDMYFTTGMDENVLFAGANEGLFRATLSDSVITIRDPGPTELRVHDPQGRVTGSVNGVMRHEIPNSVYHQEDGAVTVLFAAGPYQYALAAIAEGTYGLDIASAEDGEATIFGAADIPISFNATHNYTIDWEALAQGEPGVTIEKDSDGDGDPEETIVTSQPNMPSSPSPANNITVVSLDTDFSWNGGDPDTSDNVTYAVYFGTNTTPPLMETIGPFAADQTAFNYTLNPLTQGTTYHWQIVARDNHGVTKEGPVWKFTTTSFTSYNITLAAGWNLLSLPLIPDNTDIDAIISAANLASGNLANIVMVYTFNTTTGTWMWWNGSPASTLNTMEDGRGYWFYTTAADTLTVHGTEAETPGPDYPVLTGWDMIGFTSTSDMAPESYLASVVGKYTMLYCWDNGGWLWWMNGNPASTFTNMEPTYGYWLFMTADGTITPP